MKLRGKHIIKNRELFLRRVALVFLDILVILVSMAGALWIRFDFSFTQIEPVFLESVREYLYINMVTTLFLFWLFRLYSSLWRFASVVEMKNVVCAVLASTLAQAAGMWILDLRVPRSYPFLYLLILAALTVVDRFSYRFIRIMRHNLLQSRKAEPLCTMVVGAGAAGYMIVREMKNSKHLNRTIPCVVDDDPVKIGTYLQGIPVVGGKEEIPYYAEKYQVEEIVIAIPTLASAAKKELLDICQKTSCKILMLPGIYQLVNEEVSVSMLREVEIEDLLGRDPVKLEMEEIMDYVQGKVILVTGGGGSIGSEICRQLALHHPKQLIILDVYENNAYDIQNELVKKHPDLNLLVLIGSVRDHGRVDDIFETYHPQLVFHAAAHKHVPLMEDSPNEAIKNNVLGTYLVANAADRFGAEKMVLISTDKAVRPTNIMGASKRICELIIEAFARKSKTEYAAVRFGNVLGSNGSVIPLFRKQIAALCHTCRLNHQLDCLGYGHKIPLHLRMGQGNRSALFNLPAEYRQNRPARPEHIAKAHGGHPAGGGLGKPFDHLLGHPFGCTHDVGGVDRLVAGDEYQPLHLVFCSRGGQIPAAGNVVFHRLERVCLHERHMLVGGRVKDNLRTVFPQQLFHPAGIAHRADEQPVTFGWVAGRQFPVQ